MSETGFWLITTYIDQYDIVFLRSMLICEHSAKFSQAIHDQVTDDDLHVYVYRSEDFAQHS